MATAQGNSEASSNHKNIEARIKSININSEETETVETSKFNVTNNQIDGKSKGEVSKEIPLPSGYVLASSRENDETYNMNHKIRGHCIVFNHRVFDGITKLGERSGTNRDRDSVCSLFRGLGFKVENYNDLSVKEIKRILEGYAYRVDHSNCDCFVVVFMSHGEDGHLYGRDSIFKSEDLYSDFTAENCTSLAGKPKMFFIQACRGEGLDSGVKMLNRSLPDETDSGFISLYKIPNHVDFLICWSTVPGFILSKSLNGKERNPSRSNSKDESCLSLENVCEDQSDLESSVECTCNLLSSVDTIDLDDETCQGCQKGKYFIIFLFSRFVSCSMFYSVVCITVWSCNNEVWYNAS